MKTPPLGGVFNLAYQHVSGFAVRHPVDHLAAAGRASAVRPAAAGRASVVRPAAAGQASRSGSDFDSSFSPTLVSEAPLNPRSMAKDNARTAELFPYGSFSTF